jgi:hypothetical protein
MLCLELPDNFSLTCQNQKCRLPESMPIDRTFHNEHATIVIYISYSAMTIALIILSVAAATLKALHQKVAELESLTFPLETLNEVLGPLTSHPECRRTLQTESPQSHDP